MFSKNGALIASFVLLLTSGMAIARDAAVAGPNGKYTYSESGYSAQMTVSDVSACELKDELGCLSAVRPLKLQLYYPSRRQS
jgi:hypothetical protein